MDGDHGSRNGKDVVELVVSCGRIPVLGICRMAVPWYAAGLV